MSQNPSSEQFDVSDFKALKVEIRALCENVARLSSTIEQNTKQLSKVEILEVSHNNQVAAIGRAFKAMEVIEGNIEQHRREEVAAHESIENVVIEYNNQNAKEHKGYDKVVYLSVGFVTAVCMFWTIFGIRINNTIDDTIKSVSELKTVVAVEVGRSRQQNNNTNNNSGGQP